MEKQSKKEKKSKQESCGDRLCPIHGNLRTRGAKFKGTVKKIVDKRAVIEFERLHFYKKYERYAKKTTRLHARIPACLLNKIKVGSFVEVAECRPLSKIIHFTVTKILK